MRNLGLLAVAVLFASVIGFAGCAKKEAPPPPPPPAEQMAPAEDNAAMAPMEGEKAMEAEKPAGGMEKPMESK